MDNERLAVEEKQGLGLAHARAFTTRQDYGRDISSCLFTVHYGYPLFLPPIFIKAKGMFSKPILVSGD